MKLNFTDEYERIAEGFKQIERKTRLRYPRNLHLSEEFIQAVQSEFKRLTAEVVEEDSDGNKTTTKPDPRKVLQQVQKALPFLVQ